MNYEDFHINKTLADLVGLSWHNSPSDSPDGMWHFSDNYGDSECPAALPDYCHSWSDIGPLIEKYQIDVGFIDGFGWTAEQRGQHAISVYDNPKRAAAICIIKLLESQK